MLHIPSALFYSLTSIFMVFGNKFLLNYWNFDCIIFLILTELILNVICISVINYRKGQGLFGFQIKNDRIKYQFLSAFFYCLHSVLSLKALDGLNIPVYTIFKRCTPLASLVLSCFLFKNKRRPHEESIETPVSNSIEQRYKNHSRQITMAILAMTSGVVIAGLGDLNFEFYSYFYCGISVVCQAFYFSFIQKCGESDKNSLQVLYECSIISIPFLFFAFLNTKEYETLLSHNTNFSFTNFYFVSTFVLVVSIGSLLCFAQFWCTISNNAITTSVIGVLKSVVQTIIGVLFIDGVSNLTTLTYIGLLVNLVFGAWYTYLKYEENNFRGYNQP
jgi:solute carrier family 35 protein